MKFLVVFAAVLAFAAASTPAISTWTLHELSAAIEDPNTDPAILPYLSAALNEMMESMFAGQTPSPAIVSLPVHETWTLQQITTQLSDPSTSPAVVPYLEGALNDLMLAMHNGQDMTAITVNIPAMNVNMWNLGQLSAALENPETDPELVIYLEHALNQMMASIVAGEQITSIAVITPPGVPVVTPEPVKPEPVVVNPVEPVLPPLPIFPIVPEPTKPEELVPPVVVVNPVQPESVVSSPLLQVIINVNAQGQAIRQLQ